jgi:hypothetical protein
MDASSTIAYETNYPEDNRVVIICGFFYRAAVSGNANANGIKARLHALVHSLAADGSVVQSEQPQAIRVCVLRSVKPGTNINVASTSAAIDAIWSSLVVQPNATIYAGVDLSSSEDEASNVQAAPRMRRSVRSFAQECSEDVELKRASEEAAAKSKKILQEQGRVRKLAEAKTKMTKVRYDSERGKELQGCFFCCVYIYIYIYIHRTAVAS